MLYDPSNPVVQLCTRGIETEYSGDLEKARDLYLEAWQLAKNDLEMVTSAHYLARVQSDLVEALRWNLTALEYASKTTDQDIASLYASLYLNVAKSHEDLGNLREAQDHYLLAHNSTHDLPDNGYGNMIRKGVQAGLERVKGQVDGF